MATNSNWMNRTVPVGATPVPYDSWEQHRAAIRRDAESYRQAAAKRKARRTAAEV